MNSPAATESGEDNIDNGYIDSHEEEQCYAERPLNTNPLPKFHVLVTSLWQPLLEATRTPRQQKDPRYGGLKPHEVRWKVIKNFYDEWRKNVGPDIYPALRLTLPDRDRARNMYGIRELALAKYIIKITGMPKDSVDAMSLINWKSPSQGSVNAGDFASRCFVVFKKRPFITEFGTMTLEEVNSLLDQLSKSSKE